MTTLQKKTINLVMALILCTATYAPKANAGLLMMAATLDHGYEDATQGKIYGAGVGVAIVGFIAMVATMAPSGVITPLAGGIFILGADGSLGQDALAAAFSARYPFIDNTDVTHALAARLNEKFAEQCKVGDRRVLVSLDPAETRALLAPAALSSEQEEKIIGDLL